MFCWFHKDRVALGFARIAYNNTWYHIYGVHICSKCGKVFKNKLHKYAVPFDDCRNVRTLHDLINQYYKNKDKKES